MSDPFALDGTTARLGLPLLFAGQAQKEVFVNQALATLDGLIACVVEGERASPPTSPADGTAWLVGAGASGDWTGASGQIAVRQAGQWLLVPALDGMDVLDRSRGQRIVRLGGTWRAPATPAAPSGGAVIDVQARQAIAGLVAALQQWGVLAP